MGRRRPDLTPDDIDGDMVRAVWGQLSATEPTPAQERSCRKIAAAVLNLDRRRRSERAASDQRERRDPGGTGRDRRAGREAAIVEAYRNDPDATTITVAERFGVSSATVIRVLERAGVPRRSQGSGNRRAQQRRRAETAQEGRRT